MPSQRVGAGVGAFPKDAPKREGVEGRTEDASWVPVGYHRIPEYAPPLQAPAPSPPNPRATLLHPVETRRPKDSSSPEGRGGWGGYISPARAKRLPKLPKLGFDREPIAFRLAVSA